MREKIFKLIFGCTVVEWLNPPRVTDTPFIDLVLLVGIWRWSLLHGLGFFVFALAMGVLGNGDPIGEVVGVAIVAGLLVGIFIAGLLGALKLIVGRIRQKK